MSRAAAWAFGHTNYISIDFVHLKARRLTASLLLIFTKEC